MLDTNIIVAAALGGETRETIMLWKRGFLQLIVSDSIVREYLEVLARFVVDANRLEHWTRWLGHPTKVTRVQPPTPMQVSRDPTDNQFLEAAVTGRAEYLVTRDKDLLVLKTFRGAVIVTPEEFLASWQAPRERRPPKRSRSARRKRRMD